ncbi:hypothetical protein ABGT15_14190 [Flavobacterium enshiense]|uniref:hypothetical protein n=1 Tax=Flavobacterium enshiense TaxID=1341165 RepID=UPI00345DAF41
MKSKFILLLFSFFIVSCNNKETRVADSVKAEKLDSAVLKTLTQNWHFSIPPANPKVQNQLRGWNQWDTFTQELQQNPKGSLNAFRTKSKNLTLKGQLLELNIPKMFNKPAVKSRISTLNTKLKSLETYMSLPHIPTDKILKIIPEVSSELASIQNQMNEIIIKSEIPKEEGELIMLQALDTTRHARREVQELKAEEAATTSSPETRKRKTFNR